MTWRIRNIRPYANKVPIGWRQAFLFRHENFIIKESFKDAKKMYSSDISSQHTLKIKKSKQAEYLTENIT